MQPRATAVVEDVGGVAPGALQAVREERKAVERLLLVDPPGQLRDGRGEPLRPPGYGPVRVPEDIADQFGLSAFLGRPCLPAMPLPLGVGGGLMTDRAISRPERGRRGFV